MKLPTLKPASWPFLVTVLLSPAPLAGASGLDLHWLWEDRCLDCHGHSADFARKHLRVVAGKLQGTHHIHDLSRFLTNHYLAGMEVEAVYEMLLAQASTPPRFREECSSCHDTAYHFVRDRLSLQDGVLYGKISDQAVDTFLQHHRNLEEEDIDFFAKLLQRIAREAYRPEERERPAPLSAPLPAGE